MSTQPIKQTYKDRSQTRLAVQLLLIKVSTLTIRKLQTTAQRFPSYLQLL